MADGVNQLITLEPTGGERHRGQAVGLGFDEYEEEFTRPELIVARRDGSAGLVHSWETVTAVDGPGTRLTLFLSGCPLRCLYCHNPDTMTMREGTVEKLEAVLRRIKRMRPVFNASGGGVTLSGGEPLFQIEFTRRILSGAKALGVHTTVDTSGNLGSRLTDEDLDNIDLVLLDVKSGDEDTYHHVTGGQKLAPTIEFGNRLRDRNKPAWVRFVLVPGLTDADSNIANVADIVAGWPNVERVEILPFHNMGSDKWERLNMDYQLKDTSPPTDESLAHAADIFRSRGLTVFTG